MKEHAGDSVPRRGTGGRTSPRGVATIAAGSSLRTGCAGTPKGRGFIEVAVICLVLDIVGEQDADLKLMLADHFVVVVRPGVPVHPVIPRSCGAERALRSTPSEDARRQIFLRS